MSGQLDADVVVVGAGMAGLYLLHRLRNEGFKTIVVDKADGVGGTWYWNRYPGARCDVQSLDYQYSFDPALQEEWQWSEKYATQPEILRYLEFVADRYDLLRDIRLGVEVGAARCNDAGNSWTVQTSEGPLTCRHYVMATGCLSVPKEPDIEGTDRFAGDVYVTGRWPHEEVDFTGKRVAVIGTGSSGIQSIPLIAEQADHVTVFQRTPNFSTPAHNGPVPQWKVDEIGPDWQAYREQARWSRGGIHMEMAQNKILDMEPEAREEAFEDLWSRGELLRPHAYFADLGSNVEANGIYSEFIRNKIRSIVDDPEVAEALCPFDHPFNSKRPCLDTNYYATFNRPNVRLVNLRKVPIRAITETGIEFGDESEQFDAIVYATGFDAMTGALVAVDIEGKNGITLKEKWEHGPQTYLGLTSVGFPNLFMVTGPGSPSVLSNMAVSIEQHVDWITDTLVHLRSEGIESIEPTQTAEDGWVQHVNDCADLTLYGLANSWYLGANVPGKPRVFLPYVGGVGTYRGTCDEVVERGYLGFRLVGPDGESCNDGVVNRLQLDVMMLLQTMEELNLPTLDSMPPVEAREFSLALAAARPTGPEVGEVVDGTLPGPAGEIDYRLYRPASPGPHPVVCYFHGGGWVLGSSISDDPFCRDLCVRSNAIVVSVNYRHAPEARFPSAVDDAWAGLNWVSDNIEQLGGIKGKLVVAGWSAGGNLAAVTAQMARDSGGVELCGQMLVTPVTDASRVWPSMDENGEGYVLTRSLMDWFFDHYVDEGDRSDPRVSPLLADSLEGLPAAAVFTAEFDPLRDEGNAYADAMARAGVDVEATECRGQLHTSFGAVDVLRSPEDHRQAMADWLQKRFA